MELSTVVQAAQRGDQEAFALIVERFQHMAYVIAYAHVADRHLAEDIAQEAFTEAFQCLPQLRVPHAFPAWFRRILIKRADRITRRPAPFRALPLDAAEAQASDVLGPDEAAEQGELRFLVRHALQRLPTNDQQLLGLYYLYGYSLREISELNAIPVATLKKRLFDARQRLRHRVEQDYAQSMNSYLMSTGVQTIMQTSTNHRSLTLLGRAIRADGSALDDGPTIDDLSGIVMSTQIRAPEIEHYETAIKVIDLYAPMARHTLTTIVAGAGVGKWVVTFEILLRAIKEQNACAVWAVCSSPEFSLREFLGELRAATLDQASVLIGAEHSDSLEQRSQSGLQALHLAQALAAEGRATFLIIDESVSSEELLHELTTSRITAIAWINRMLAPDEAPPAHALVQAATTVIVMSKELAKRHIWPAIDPIRSCSKLMSSNMLSTEHKALATQGQELLRSHEHLDAIENSAVDGGLEGRARRLLRYQMQPFFVAEEFTGRKGVAVSLTRTMQDTSALLAGHYDQRSEEEVTFIGALPIGQS